jgi:hypothetical protein
MKISIKELRQIISEVIGYHGSHQVDLSEVVPYEVEKRLSSLGTWFTSDPERAKVYGPNVYEVEVPDGNFYKAPTDDFAKSFYDQALVGSKLTPQEKEMVDSMLKGGPPPDRKTNSLMKNVFLRRGHPDEWKWEAKEFVYRLFRDWDYLTAFRGKLQSQGYDGILWKDSNIDSPDVKHDVYLIFGKVSTKRLRPKDTI